MLEKFLGARALTLRLTMSYRLDRFHRRHPKAGAAAALVVLLGTGVTAFGVAPLTVVPPATAPASVQLITESVDMPGMAAQLEALESHSLKLHRAETLRNGDTADGLLRRLGIDDAEAARFLRSDALARTIFDGKRGRQVRIASDSGAAGLSTLRELVMLSPATGEKAETHFTRLRIVRDGEQFSAREETAPLARQLRNASGSIQSTFFAAADTAKLPDDVTEQLADIFSEDFDFNRNLRRGDQFAVVWETLMADGEPVSWNQGAGRVVAARFVANGKVHEAMWFSPEDNQNGAYYGLDGKSKSRGFLASPLAFSRVTSGFSTRLHPIFQTWKAHLGVDFAAPVGTPVRAVGDGVVEFAGTQSGYGQVIQIKHSAEKATLYAHLSSIDVKLGQKVSQSDTIGAVGTTGWSTGPHLHFEFKQDGQQVDPLSMARSSNVAELNAAARARLAATGVDMREQLASVRVAGSRMARME